LFSFLLWIRGAVDEGLIRRGELLLSLDFLEDYELSLLNDSKVRRPFKITWVYCFHRCCPIPTPCLIGRLRGLLGSS
jgi:hypothetical protein